MFLGGFNCSIHPGVSKEMRVVCEGCKANERKGIAMVAGGQQPRDSV